MLGDAHNVCFGGASDKVGRTGGHQLVTKPDLTEQGPYALISRIFLVRLIELDPAQRYTERLDAHVDFRRGF